MSLEDAITDLAAAVREMAEAMRGQTRSDPLPASVAQTETVRDDFGESVGIRGMMTHYGVSTQMVDPAPIGTPLPDRWCQNFKHAEIAERRRLSLQDEADAFRAACMREGRRSTDWNEEFTAWLTDARPTRVAQPPPATSSGEPSADAIDFELCQQARAGKFGKRIQKRAEGGARPEVIRGMVMDRDEQAARRKAAKVTS